MAASVTFTGNLLALGNNTGIEVPPDVVDQLGAGKRPPVRVEVNGYEYRSTIAVMHGKFLIPFSADKRAATGLSGGDPIAVVLTVDDSPRTVEVPDDLGAALDAAGVRDGFDALAPSYRKAHVTSVESAKTPETRARRIAAVVTKLGA